MKTFLNQYRLSKVTSLILSLSFCLFINSESTAQFYYGHQTEFGKNRVQHKDRLWQFFKFEKYDTYFYLGGKDVALFISESAARNIPEIEEMLDYSLEEKIQFIVYNKQSDFHQTNIGLINDVQNNIGGATKIVGNKVLIYFEGDHQKLEKQIRSGIGEVLLNQMMYGGNWREMIKNSTLLNLPDWYTKGLISYMGKDWDIEIDNRVKDGILSKRYTKFNRLQGTEAVYAGHSLWHFIAENYGKSTIPNIIYMTRVSRNIESGFVFVLGESLRSITEKWQNYYSSIYSDLENNTTKPSNKDFLKKTKSSIVYSQFKISPDGKYACYTSNDMGQYKLFVQNMTNNKSKKVVKANPKLDRVNDYSFPITAWHPSSKMLAFITEVKGEVTLNFYNPETRDTDKKPPLFNLEKVLDMSYSDDGKKLVMSVIQAGQSDIIVYTIASNNIENVTRDGYDDLNARFIAHSTEIVFSSNRKNDTLKAGQKPTINEHLSTRDLFIYEYKNKNQILKRFTQTKSQNENMPMPYDTVEIAYLGDQNGIQNRYLAHMDSAIAYVDTSEHYRYFSESRPITNYSRNIIEQDLNVKSKQFSEVLYYNGSYHLYFNEKQTSGTVDAVELDETKFKAKHEKEEKKSEQTEHLDTLTFEKPVRIPHQESKKIFEDPKKIDINNYYFENERPAQTVKKDTAVVGQKTVVTFNAAPSAKESDKTKPATKSLLDKKLMASLKEPSFVVPKQRNYKLIFSPDQLITQLDNGFFSNNYQKFTGSAVYYNPGITGLMKIGISDVLENHRIIGGVRISPNLKNNEYVLSYEDRSKRWDKQVMLHRQSVPANRSGDNTFRVLSHTLKYGLRYSFNDVECLKLSLSVRNDRSTVLATDVRSLQTPNTFDYWGIFKAEYIYDNTLPRGLNLYYGTRFKAFSEYFNRLDKLSQNLAVFGVDLRHYHKIHRNLIWASRFASSASVGTERIVYYLGAVDNWINLSANQNEKPTFNTKIPVATDKNYAYQAIATNMRGFSQNIRNGTNFAVINNEIRFPIFNYLVNHPLRSDILNNFQVIAFGDVGSAWTGLTPWSNESAVNIDKIVSKPVTVYLQSTRSPLVAGYGWGMRTRLFGYYVRTDWARGISDGDEVQDSMFYLSLSLDF